MTPKYRLPDHLVKKAATFSEFANGGMQITIKLKDGTVFEKAIVSNCSWIIALRGHKELPFPVSEIEDLFQTEEDKSPKQRDGWEFLGGDWRNE
jgi:hypothetical protein